jgi:hypothetical protein
MQFFFHGSLMDRELLALVIGRAIDDLRMEAATIHEFVCRRALAADETVWDFDTWAAAERPLFMEMVQERMLRYGSITAAENDALWPQVKAEVERRFRRRQSPSRVADEEGA